MLYKKTKGISQTLINNSCYFDYINKHREQHYEQNNQSQDKYHDIAFDKSIKNKQTNKQTYKPKNWMVVTKE